MDINHNKFTNNTSGLHLAMDDHIFYEHQVPFDPIYSYNSYPLQAHESSSLTQPFTSKPPFNHQIINQGNGEEEEEEEEELGAMKEMMYKIAAMQPVDIDPATIRKPKRRNVRISDDPQSVAARHRREKISEKIRILQRLVPGGTKLDTASMLDEAIRYVKFLKRQIRQLQSNHNPPCGGIRACLGAEDWQIISPYHGHELNFGSSSRGNN